MEEVKEGPGLGEGTLSHTDTHTGGWFRGQRQLPLLGAKGRRASLEGYALDLEVAVSGHVVDGLQVETVGELELMSIWQPDGQVCLVKGEAHLGGGGGSELGPQVPRDPAVGPGLETTNPSPHSPPRDPPHPSHLHNTPRLEGEGRLPVLGPPGAAVLAVAHDGVGVPVGVEARVEVQTQVIAVLAQVQHETRE